MVGDDMFAPERDSGNVGRQGTATRANGRGATSGGRSGHLSGTDLSALTGAATPGSSAAPSTGGGGAPAEDIGIDVLRRLRDRVDRNVRLVDRMRADPLAPEPPGLADLIDTARRLRHDAETLLLLAGVDAGSRPGGPARLSTLLDEAVDATEEPMRVDVRSGPAAGIEQAAATELLHVVAEVVDHITAIHPGGRIEVSHRTDSAGGIVVEVRTASTTRYDPSGRRGMAAAARMAQRSRSGLVVRTPPPGPPGSSVPIATVHCPASAVHVQEPPYDESRYDESRYDESRYDESRYDGPRGGGSRSEGARDDGVRYADARYPSSPETSYPSTLGALDAHAEPWLPAVTRSNGYGHDAEAETPVHGLPSVDPLPRRRSDTRRGVDGLFGGLSADPFGDPFSAPSSAPSSSSAPGRSDPDPAPARFDRPSNGRSYPDAEPVDELFGPLTGLSADPADHSMATPIFEAVASAWFQHDTATPDATDWESPNDQEWRAAAERAAAPDPATTFTAEGLPRRRPGGRLVAPRLRDGGGDAAAATPAPADRVPDRVRERLATYQRGLRQGRHRAEPNEPGDAAAW